MVGGLRLAPAGYRDSDVQELVAQVQAEYVLLYGEPDETPVADDAFSPPVGGFLLGREDGLPVAMGGWRRRTDLAALGGRRVAEVKRMYVAPAARRRGHARTMLVALEDAARAAGSDVVVLETGTMQPEAIALYEGAGYQPIAAYGWYAGTPEVRCYAKRL